MIASVKAIRRQRNDQMQDFITPSVLIAPWGWSVYGERASSEAKVH